jgi:hypothetical protein
MKVNFNRILQEKDKYIYEYHTKRKGFFISKPVHIRFISKYPHYVLEDIFWMLKCTDQTDKFTKSISRASDQWSSELDIQIGTLITKTAKNADFSRQVLNDAVTEQGKLEEEWSQETGKNYPDLEMPKRDLF